MREIIGTAALLGLGMLILSILYATICACIRDIRDDREDSFLAVVILATIAALALAIAAAWGLSG